MDKIRWILERFGFHIIFRPAVPKCPTVTPRLTPTKLDHRTIICLLWTNKRKHLPDSMKNLFTKFNFHFWSKIAINCAEKIKQKSLPICGHWTNCADFYFEFPQARNESFPPNVGFLLNLFAMYLLAAHITTKYYCSSTRLPCRGHHWFHVELVLVLVYQVLVCQDHVYQVHVLVAVGLLLQICRLKSSPPIISRSAHWWLKMIQIAAFISPIVHICSTKCILGSCWPWY